MSEETKETAGAEEKQTQEAGEVKESQETSEKKETKEAKAEKKPSPTISELMEAEKSKEAKVDETKAKETEEADKDKDKKEEGRKPVKKSASDEIRDLRKRAQDAEAKAEKEKERADKSGEAIKEIDGLKQKIAAFEKSPEGKDVKKEAKAFEFDEKKVREDLEDQGWSDSNIDLYIDNIKARIKSDKALADLNARLDARDKADKDRQAEEYKASTEEFQQEVKNNVREFAKGDYAYMFEKSDSDNGDLPEMKPEFDKKAMEIVELTSVETTDEKGKTITYSPLLQTKEGLAMLLREVNREHEANKKAKDKVEKEKNLAKKTVANPSSNTKGSEKKNPTMSELMEAEAKKRG